MLRSAVDSEPLKHYGWQHLKENAEIPSVHATCRAPLNFLYALHHESIMQNPPTHSRSFFQIFGSKVFLYSAAFYSSQLSDVERMS